ncbi:acyltransferase [Glutamicibacter protophormiae]|uniref:acyltransferase n=1 Tax=Glutamicibacter protophormiae TaxID=37930 RepID=UPI003A8CEF56
MTKLTVLSRYADNDGNTIEYSKTIDKNISIDFKGKNNRVMVADGARISKLIVTFDCDNGTLVIGSNTKVGGFMMSIRVGQDSTVIIGDNVSTTNTCVVSAVEGSKVTFGNDVMIATNNQFRADDGHPIFDVHTGKRVNPAGDISIGNHVWFAVNASALGGSKVGDGSVIGFGSLVTGEIPNNCIAAGSPARVIRKDIAWERPHLSLVKPYYKPDSSTVETSDEFWNVTEA